jgi:hypothetical protein
MLKKQKTEMEKNCWGLPWVNADLSCPALPRSAGCGLGRISPFTQPAPHPTGLEIPTRFPGKLKLIRASSSNVGRGGHCELWWVGFFSILRRGGQNPPDLPNPTCTNPIRLDPCDFCAYFRRFGLKFPKPVWFGLVHRLCFLKRGGYPIRTKLTRPTPDYKKKIKKP